MARIRHTPGFFNKRPTRPEQLLINIATRHNMPIRYTGDGQFWLKRPSAPALNPDFKVNGQRKVIEVFGFYWHPLSDADTRTAAFRACKDDTLIVWEDEFDNENQLVAKLFSFLHNPEFITANQAP